MKRFTGDGTARRQNLPAWPVLWGLGHTHYYLFGCTGLVARDDRSAFRPTRRRAAARSTSPLPTKKTEVGSGTGLANSAVRVSPFMSTSDTGNGVQHPGMMTSNASRFVVPTLKVGYLIEKSRVRGQREGSRELRKPVAGTNGNRGPVTACHWSKSGRKEGNEFLVQVWREIDSASPEGHDRIRVQIDANG